MTHDADIPESKSTADLYAAAYRGELQAAERYAVLAGQMDGKRTPEVEELFRALARAEWEHASLVAQNAGEKILAAGKQFAVRPGGAAELGATASDEPLNAQTALASALVGERRAVAFFDHLGAATEDPKLKALATSLRDEEIEHVRRCSELLRRYPVAGRAPDDDLEPTLPAG